MLFGRRIIVLYIGYIIHNERVPNPCFESSESTTELSITPQMIGRRVRLVTFVYAMHKQLHGLHSCVTWTMVYILRP